MKPLTRLPITAGQPKFETVEKTFFNGSALQQADDIRAICDASGAINSLKGLSITLTGTLIATRSALQKDSSVKIHLESQVQ